MALSFFERVDSLGIVENHIKQVLGLEKSESESLLQDYKSIRQDLVDRISRYPQGTFTRQHLQGVLAQVNGAIDAMTKHLGGSTIQSSYRAALMGSEHTIKELRTFDEEFTGAVAPINLNAALIAHDTSQLLVTRYKTNLEAYGNDLQTQITNGLFSAVIGEASYDQVVGRISQFFVGQEWMLHRIVRTELHHVYGVAKLKSLEQVDGAKKTLIHPLDGRTGEDSAYAATLGLIVELSDPFEYNWKGKKRSFMTPPDRPNDRSVMIPYMDGWGSDSGSATVTGRFPAA